MIIYENIKKLESVGQLSANSLVNADCLEAMKYIADKSIDCTPLRIEIEKECFDGAVQRFLDYKVKFAQ